jgi:hypothetical protein
VSFGWSTFGRRRRPTAFVIAGEEVGFDEILFAVSKEAKPFSGTTPAAGGGAAGAVLLASPREEGKG